VLPKRVQPTSRAAPDRAWLAALQVQHDEFCRRTQA